MRYDGDPYHAGSSPDSGVLAIAARFGGGAGIAIGDQADTMAASAAGLAVPCRKRPFMPSPLPPGILTTTSVGSFLDLPHQFGPRSGYFWDVSALSAYGFTAGTIGVSINAPLVTPQGNPYAIEPVASFTQAGILFFSRKGMPLLDASERLVFTVTGTLTGQAQISGEITIVPAERISEYME